MNPTETVRLTRIVASIAPAQKIDEYTADAWQPVLRDVPMVDALEAVRRLAQRQPFIATSDIVAEVKVIRRDRLDRADATFVYDGDADDVVGYKRALAAHRRSIGDGAEPPAAPELTVSVPPAAISGVFRRPPRAETRRAIEAAPPVRRGGPSEESLAYARAEMAKAAQEANGGGAA